MVAKVIGDVAYGKRNRAMKPDKMQSEDDTHCFPQLANNTYHMEQIRYSQMGTAPA
jgi:hypothetical protein